MPTRMEARDHLEGLAVQGMIIQRVGEATDQGPAYIAVNNRECLGVVRDELNQYLNRPLKAYTLA